MSHWKSGKLGLNCSLAVLKRALLNIMSEWEEYMKTSEEGGLTIYNNYTNQRMSGYHLSVSLDAPGVSYADIGFKRDADGEWITDIDEAYLRVPEIQTLQGAVKREVSAMKAQAQARAKNGRVVRVNTAGGRTKVFLDIPVEEKHKRHA
jgi:hypothetical protein